jgi:hypothetical protein
MPFCTPGSNQKTVGQGLLSELPMLGGRGQQHDPIRAGFYPPRCHVSTLFSTRVEPAHHVWRENWEEILRKWQTLRVELIRTRWPAVELATHLKNLHDCQPSRCLQSVDSPQFHTHQGQSAFTAETPEEPSMAVTSLQRGGSRIDKRPTVDQPDNVALQAQFSLEHHAELDLRGAGPGGLESAADFGI